MNMIPIIANNQFTVSIAISDYGIYHLNNLNIDSFINHIANHYRPWFWPYQQSLLTIIRFYMSYMTSDY